MEKLLNAHPLRELGNAVVLVALDQCGHRRGGEQVAECRSDGRQQAHQGARYTHA